MSRKIQNLKWASLTSEEAYPKQKDLTNAQRAGLRFQKKACRVLRDALSQDAAFHEAPWIEFEDGNGYGKAQPDAFAYDASTHKIIIFECKLKQSPDADKQMRHLYAPLLRHMFSPRRIIRVQVCHMLSRDGTAYMSDPADTLVLHNTRREHLLYFPFL